MSDSSGRDQDHPHRRPRDEPGQRDRGGGRAGDSYTLLIIGLAISIPLVIFGATLLLKLMERWPDHHHHRRGAARLRRRRDGRRPDPAVERVGPDANAPWLHTAAPAVGAILVVAVGKWLAARAEAKEEVGPAVDLAKADPPGGAGR